MNQSATSRFNYFEKVTISSSDEIVNGKLGAILGLAQSDNGCWNYTVHIYDTGLCWCFEEEQLFSTGEFAKLDEFYDGSSIKVKST